MILYKKNGVVIRTPVESDIQYLKNNLRALDIEEIRASNNHSPEEAIRHGVRRSSWCVTTLLNGKPVAIGGMVPDEKSPKTAAAWMLATDGLMDMCPTFLKLSRKMIALMLDRTDFLYNFVDARNEKAISWLEWCGAKIDDPKPYGVNNMPFRFFSITRTSNV